MSGVIDKNVVQMVFDTVGFQKSAEETLSILNKLKDALNFEGAVRGLENLGNNVKNAGMDTLYEGVYKVQDGFNALDIVATRVIQNITDKIQNLATDLIEKVTLEPLKAGLQEYETQINSVQTILSNTNDALIEKGLTTEHDRIEKVNSVLDDLNKYADMTIYNFTEMTRNIGTFTAAGVELDTAATSIKGIANLAAMSGSNSQQASTAMYQLSQAIAAGSVKLQDWNSVVNAGMGGKLFQNELIDTAKAMGVADEQFIALTEGATTFRESLSSGWISAEVLTNTLEKFTAGSEGYTKSQVEQMQQLWRARGYSEQQIEELTGSINKLTEEEEANLRTKWAEKGFSPEQIDHILSMGSAATDAATKVKTFTQLLDTVGEALQSGWTQSWEYIIGDFEQAKMLWTEISDIMNLYIGKSADARNSVLAEWSKAAYTYNEAGELIRAADGSIVEGGKMVREEMGGRELIIQGLRNAFQGLFEISIQLSNAWKTDFLNIGKDTDISITADTLKKLSLSFYDFTDNFKKALVGENGPTELLTKLKQEFEFFARSMRNAFDGITSIFSGLGNVLNAFFHSSFFDMHSLSSIITAISSVAGSIEDFGLAIKNQLGNDSAGKNLEGLTKFFNGIQKILDSTAWVKLDFIKYGFNAIGDVFSYIIGPSETIATLLGKLGDKMTVFAQAISSIFNNEDTSKFETLFGKIAKDLEPFIDNIKQILSITDNGSVTGLQAFFNQFISLAKGQVKGLDFFDIIAKSIESVINVFKILIGVATPIFQAFANVFGPSLFNIVKYLSDFVNGIHSLTSALVPSSARMNEIYTVFKGLFEVIRSVGIFTITALKSVWEGLTEVIKKFLPTEDTLANKSELIYNKLHAFSEAVLELASTKGGISSLSDIIVRLGDKMSNFMAAIQNINPLEKLAELFNKIGEGIKRALGGTDDMTLLDTIVEKIKGFLDSIKNILSDENGQIDFVKVLEAGGIGLALKKVIDAIKDIKDRTNDLKGIFGFIDDFKEILEGLGESFADWTKAQNIKFIATAMLEMAGAMFILSMIDPVALGKAIAAMASMFQMIERVIVILSSIDKGKVTAGAAAIAAIGTAMLEMAAAVAIIGNMDLESAIQGVVAIGALVAALVIATQQLSAIEKDVPKVAGAMIAMALAIDLLAIAVAALGHMDFENLAKGLGAVAVMMAGLVGSAIALSKWGKNFSAGDALGLILMAEAIKILGDAVTKVADLSWEQIAKGLTVMAAGLIAMVGAAAIVATNHLSDDLLALGASLVMLGISMELLTSAAKGISGVSWEDLGKLAAVLAGALIMLGVASYAINGANLLMIAGAIALVATAFLELNAALGLAQIVGPLCTSIGFAIEGMSHSLESFAHSAARDAFLQFLKDAILFLPQLAVGLANALVEMIAALGAGAAKIINAVVQIGKAVLQGIVTLLPEIFNVIKTFIEQLVQLLIAEIPRLFEVLTLFFEQLWVFLAAQVPNFFMFLTTVFTELFTFLQTEGPLLIETIRLMLDTILQAIMTEAPVIGETFLTLLRTLLDVINTAIPEIAGTLLNLILTLLQQLAEFVPQMAQAAMNIILGFLQAIADNIGQITEAAISIAIGFMQGITEKMPELVDTAFKMIIGFIEGLAKAIEENHEALFEAVGHLITAIVEALIDGITKLGETIGEWFTGSGGILESIGNFANDIFEAGANLVQGFIDGLLSMPGKLWDSACSLANDAWNAITNTLDEHSPSRLTYMGGKNFTLGFINGISDYSSDAALTSEGMAYGVLGAFNSAMEDGADTYIPVIAPVLDDSSVIKTMSKISGIDDEVSANFINNLTLNLNSSINALNDKLIDVDSSIVSAENKMQDVLNVLDNVMIKQDELYERVDYWLESIEGDTLEIAAQAMNGSNIYMDTGSLVGAIAPEMDNQLGYRQIMSERGVY